MPKSLIVIAGSDLKRNLSNEVFAAFEDKGAASVSAVSSMQAVYALDVQVLDGEEEEADGAPEPPDPQLESRLDAAQVEQMLADPDDWILAIANGDGTDALAKSAVSAAWAHPVADDGPVKMTTRNVTVEEQAVLDDAKERLSPKGSATRYSTVLSMPVASIALVAAAAAAFVGFDPEKQPARPGMLVAAAVAIVLSVALSVVATNVLSYRQVRLCRLDELLKNARAAPRTAIPNLCVGLFVVALVLAVFSVVPLAGADPPSASFGKATTTTTGTATEVALTVKWADLGDGVAKVKTAVDPSGAGPSQVVVTPKASDGSVSQDIKVKLGVPGPITVSTQGQGPDGKPVGDLITHTYAVP